MSRKRLIAPEFFTHGDLYDAEARAGLPLRVAFAGLWTAADRRGLFRWKPRELKLAILPYDSVDFSAVLAALEDAGFIESYVVDGQDFGRIPGFTNWQSFHPHEKPSSIPEPTNVGSEPTKVRRSNAALTTAPIAAPTSTLTPTMPPPKAAAKVERFADAFGACRRQQPREGVPCLRCPAWRRRGARRDSRGPDSLRSIHPGDREGGHAVRDAGRHVLRPG
jgi:hypothetical protein